MKYAFIIGLFFLTLNVKAQWTPTGNTQFITTSHLNGPADYGFSLEDHGSNPELFIENNIYGVNRQVFYFGHANDTHNIFGISTSSNSGSTWSPSFVISQNGNIGIGINSPEAKLTVSGNIVLPANQPTSSNDLVHSLALRFRSKGIASDAVVRKLDWQLKGIQTSIWGSGDLALLESTDGQDYEEVIRFTALGKVGIGTANPDAKLTVKGNIHAREIKVDMAGAIAPDYVFTPDYPLMPLDQVSEYIQQHSHLPDIPSASEMEENGMKLKEMNLLLLKKVEELTLYVIDLQKRIIELEKE